MNCVRVKPGVTIVPSPGGFHIIAILDMVARSVGHDITITSGSDGEHSGPGDPHHDGNAYDIRSHDLPDDGQQVLQQLTQGLGNRFYAFLEDAGTDNEHIHCQVAKGTVWP